MKKILSKRNLARASVLLVVSVLALTIFVQVAIAALTLKNVKTWCWTNNTDVSSVVKGDVDVDGKTEIVTGGRYYDGARYVAQLCVWNGATLALEGVKTWHWTGDTLITSLAVDEADGDGQMEIVTGGHYFDGTREVAQLCVWNGATLALEGVKTWYWTGNTHIHSISVGNVDADGGIEIVTGGYYNDGSRNVAQLCVWNGATLALENVKTWYWTSNTYILTVAAGNVDGDAQTEITTGGCYDDGTRGVAQLCVWNGATLALENVKTWHWGAEQSATRVSSVAIGDVDGDAQTEITTGGYYWYDRNVARLCVWNGATLGLENFKNWNWSVADNTVVSSVAVGDADGDTQMEIITGGDRSDISSDIAQLCVWSGATLGLENVQTWQWTFGTWIKSLVVGNVDGDAQVEIITGGAYGSTPVNAQLCIWAS